MRFRGFQLQNGNSVAGIRHKMAAWSVGHKVVACTKSTEFQKRSTEIRRVNLSTIFVQKQTMITTVTCPAGGKYTVTDKFSPVEANRMQSEKVNLTLISHSD